MTPADREQLDRVVKLVRAVLGLDSLGAYLHGSAVLGGLRRHSDLDVLVVSRHRTTSEEKSRLAEGLLEVSAAYPGPPRPVELTIVAQPDVRPWCYPPRIDFQYGEWLRGNFERGGVEPARTEEPDLVTLLTMVLGTGRPLFGPPPAELLDPVPPGEYARAVREGMDGLAGDFETDTRNAVLTAARIWCTLATGEIRSKNDAADWALAQLPDDCRAPLARARAIYMGEERERWDDLGVRPYADHVTAEIRNRLPG
ncbi:MAG: aminoglycoside adenylyltransferase domain-containing protein [Actinomycetota bacterium]